MAKFRALMLWTDAWLADTSHLTRCERGTYFDLLVLMWRTPGCRLPNDDGWLGRHLRMTPSEVVAELRPIISEFCQTDGNYIWQKRLKKEFGWSEKKRRVASDNAKRRWNKEKDLCEGNATQHCSTVTVTVPVAVPENSITKRELVESGVERTPLPQNWSPMKEELSPVDLWELGKFRDYQLVRGTTCANWDAQWRLWKSKEVYGKGYRGELGTSTVMDIETRRKALQRLRNLNGGISDDEEIRAEVRRDT